MKEKSLKKIITKSLILYNLLIILVAVICYYLIPLMLNYPPNSINTEFEKRIDAGYSYYFQYLIIVIVAMLFSNTNIFFELKKVKGWETLANTDKEDVKKLNRIREICFSAPTKLYIMYAAIPPIAVFAILLLTGAGYSLAINLGITILVFLILVALLIYVFCKRMFDFILINIGNTERCKKKLSLGYKGKIFFQFLPITLLVGFMAYTMTKMLYDDKISDLVHNDYSQILINSNIAQSNTIEEVKYKLYNIEKINKVDTLFIVEPYSVIYQDTNEEISDFFIKYIFLEGKDGKTYGYYASGIQGTYEIININGKTYAVGIMYKINIANIVLVLTLTILGLIIVVVSFLYFFAKDLTGAITEISEYMKKLTEGQVVDYDKKIPVTSNDELGELTVNFNKILNLEKKYVETIKENQDALVENGRLSSLGQLVGGIAHNLKTPIMSISGNLQGIQDLIVEYDSSIGDSEVTPEDHKAIAKDMQELVDKTRIHLSYMSDVITAIKGQAVQLDSSEDQIFGALEVVSRIEILMRHELKSALIEMDVDIEEEAKTAYIKGDVNSLVQVLNNLIQNSIYAYQGKQHQVINFKVTKEDNKLYFRIQDYGCGIPDNVKEKLFKEMVTTKGKNGTGLGLYMSYSTIKGKFNGGFDFKSEVGKGTTFIISIPVSK